MNKAFLNDKIFLDLESLVDTRLLIQANSGGGKSYLIRRLLEQSHGKVQQIVIDLEGEFGTLREKYDYILAGKDGDVPANPKSAPLLARKLLELGVSAIVDLYELPHQDRKRFVRLFLEAMIDAPKELWHPVLLVIDEAHQFCPEKGEAESAAAVIDICTRGRKRGYCAILATQRLSKMNKDAAAECNNKLIGRTGLDIDMKRAAEELGFTGKEQYLSLRSLESGEFFAFGPAISRQVIPIKIGTVETQHPKAGARFKTHTVQPTAKIREVISKLADLPKEAEEEARTVDELKKEVRELKRHKCEVVNQNPIKIEKIEVPMVGKRALEGLTKSEKELRRASKLILDASQNIESNINKLSGEIAKVQRPNNPIPPKESLAKYPIANSIKVTEEKTSILSGPEQRIVNAIAWMESIGVEEPEQTAVAFLAGYTVGGGGFNNPKGSLRSKGLIEYRGNNLVLTVNGRIFASPPLETLNTAALHEKILARLPGPEQRLLKPLLMSYPGYLSNDELAQQSGYQVGSGGFNNPKGRLKTLGLIEYPVPGTAKARDILFI